MKLFGKISLLILSLLPLAWGSYYAAGAPAPSYWHIQVGLMILLGIPVFVVYLVLVIRNSKLSPHARVVWIMLMFMLAIPVQVAYWYRWIWRD